MPKTNVATIVMAIMACVTLLVVVEAQQKRGKAQKLTGDDYVEIQQLSARYGQAIDSCADDGYAYSGHLILNLVIRPSPEGATGNSYLVELGGRDPNRITRLGNYEDVYVKTVQGWRIKKRQFIPSKTVLSARQNTPAAPGSLQAR